MIVGRNALSYGVLAFFIHYSGYTLSTALQRFSLGLIILHTDTAQTNNTAL